MTVTAEKIAAWITRAVGTVWCAVFFIVVALVSLPAAIASDDVLVIVSWFAQTLLQLVLLSVLQMGTDAAAARTEAVIQDTHRLAIQEHDDTRRILADLTSSHNDLHRILRSIEPTDPPASA